MKIGLVCPYNLFKGGGVQECVMALQTELSSRGHEVLILTPEPRSTPDTIPPFVRLLGTATDVKSPFHTTAQVSVSVDVREVDQLLAAEKFDLLHFHEPWVPLLARQILRRTQTKNIATFHAKLPESVVSRTIEKAITPYTRSVLKYFDALTAVSPAAAEYVKGLTTQPVTIIPNGTYIDKFATSEKFNQTEPTILYIGRLERRKGVKYLLDAFALIQAQLPKAKLVIAGDGSDRRKLINYSLDLKLKNIDFLGFISETEKLDLFRQADLFVSPALFGESFGIVLLEAMAAGVPIVAGDNPGYSGVLQGRGQLSLVDPRDAAAFAGRVLLLLQDKEIRGSWQNWASDYIKQFDYPHIVDQYERLYKQVSRR